MKVRIHKKGSAIFGSPEVNIYLETKSIELMEQLIKQVKVNFDL